MSLRRKVDRLEERARPGGGVLVVDVYGLTEAEAEQRIAEAAERLGPRGGVLLIDDGTDPGPFRPKGAAVDYPGGH